MTAASELVSPRAPTSVVTARRDSEEFVSDEPRALQGAGVAPTHRRGDDLTAGLVVPPGGRVRPQASATRTHDPTQLRDGTVVGERRSWT